MSLVLASASPRRAELLAAAGIPFIVRATNIDESLLAGESPEAHVRRLAAAKANTYGAPDADTFVLAADTTVVIDGVVLGKPRDAGEAVDMLARLSDATHDVLTAIAIAHHGGLVEDLAVSRVTFHPLSTDEIGWYVRTGEPADKAGGYAVQGLASRFIARIEGSYANVVGLPVDLVYRHLRALGFSV